MLQARNVTVTTIPTQIVDSSVRRNRWSGTLLNRGPQTVYIDGDDGVTTSDYPMELSDTIAADLYAQDEIWGITESGVAIVNILEQFWE